jgi:hypothetical protein
MNITKYYHPEDYLHGGPAGYYTADNVYCGETPQEFIQSSILGHCCCGDVDGSLIYLKSLLVDISQGKWRGSSGNPAESFTVYAIDKLGLIEHGVGLPGWLTSTGKELLEDLTVLYPQAR